MDTKNDKHNGFELVQAENGGWILYGRNVEQGFIQPIIGAYTNAQDMLNALSQLLSTERSGRDHD